MMSNQREQISEKIAELSKKHPKVKFLGVYADLATKTSIKEFKELIEKEMKGLDIGVVCLNAGQLIKGPVDLISDWDVERIVNLNALHPVYMAKALLP
mmetsp:Transcript_5235/g.6414  ORF Transcript_5235/g.6414 Transcript_5235/m.6414 type:complete len:98 (+) Transcript_5235:422-715(+)